jgi:hypothetical protein
MDVALSQLVVLRHGVEMCTWMRAPDSRIPGSLWPPIDNRLTNVHMHPITISPPTRPHVATSTRSQMALQRAPQLALQVALQPHMIVDGLFRVDHLRTILRSLLYNWLCNWLCNWLVRPSSMYKLRAAVPSRFPSLLFARHLFSIHTLASHALYLHTCLLDTHSTF